jgi:hypothetical protein
MSARQRLNRAFFNGSLLIAGVVGAATGSLLTSGLTLAVLVAFNIAVGEIRFRKRKR